MKYMKYGEELLGMRDYDRECNNIFLFFMENMKWKGIFSKN